MKFLGVSRMESSNSSHDIGLDDVPSRAIKLTREAIEAGRLVRMKVFDNLPSFLLQDRLVQCPQVDLPLVEHNQVQGLLPLLSSA